MTGSDRVRMHGLFPALFSYNSSTKYMIAHDRHSYRMCVIKRHVTPKWFPWRGGVRACVIGSALGVLSRTSGSYNLIIFYELVLSLVICPFPAILFLWGAPSIITQPFFRVFSDMFEVLCSTLRVLSMTSAFSLWYFY